MICLPVKLRAGVAAGPGTGRAGTGSAFHDNALGMPLVLLAALVWLKRSGRELAWPALVKMRGRPGYGEP